VSFGASNSGSGPFGSVSKRRQIQRLQNQRGYTLAAGSALADKRPTPKKPLQSIQRQAISDKPFHSAECTCTSGIMSVKPIPTATHNADTIRRFMSVSSVL